MPPQSLRKACHACTRAKRRCTPQLPSCDRCAKKSIPCVYDLEPVSRSWPDQREVLSSERQQDLAGCGSGVRRGRGLDAGKDEGQEDLKIVYHSVKSAREASITAMASGHHAESAATHPKLVGTPQLTAWVLGFFADVVRDAQMDRGTPFVHAHILHTTEREQTDETSTTKIEYFRRITRIHHLTIQSLTMLLNKSRNKSSDMDLGNLVAEAFTSTHQIWISPPETFDTSLIPWETWLLAESIRRSMFAAVMIKGLLSFVRTGYVTYEPFFESCPFDPRAGLWEATSEEEWETVLKKHGGEHTKLKSYDEFVRGERAESTTDTDSGSAPSAEITSRLNPNEDGAFQRLLFLCYHSDAGIQHLSEPGDLE